MGLFNKSSAPKEATPPCAIHADDRALIKPEDVAWWDSLSLNDWQALETEDNIFRLAAFQKFTKTDHLPDAEAGKKVRLSFPAFYWRLEHRADEKFQLGADDAKLPYVLKDRINRAVMGRVVEKQAVEKSSSFNALVRQLIRSGRI